MLPAPPILVVDLFPELQAGLLELLDSLGQADWLQPVSNSTWTVKELALHLLGDDLGNLSRRRDGYSPPSRPPESWPDLVALINESNEQWVAATRRLSPPLLVDLLRFAAPQMVDYFRSLDLFALGGPVSWAGPQPAPVWLDLAREYTERWYHQQQIRDAVNRPGFKEPRFFAPVLATFVHALPQAFREVKASEESGVLLTITGDAGGSWCVMRENRIWTLFAGRAPSPRAEVTLDQEVAWRLFTKGLNRSAALGQSVIKGDRKLGERIFDSVAILG